MEKFIIVLFVLFVGYIWGQFLLENILKRKKEDKLNDINKAEETEHKSYMREMYNKSNNLPYKSINSLEEAKKYKNAYIIFQGDYGGIIYLTCPVNKVKCNEEKLQDLLKYIEEHYWNDLPNAGIYFEILDENQKTIAGGMGGGKIDKELWINPEITKLGIADKIQETICDNDKFKWITEKLDDYINVEFELYSKDWSEFVTDLGTYFDVLEHATEQRYEDMNFSAFADWMKDLWWVDENKNIKVVIYGDISLDVKDFMEIIKDFWKYDAEKYIASGKNRKFIVEYNDEIYMLDNFEKAKEAENSYVIFEGNTGGMPYLTCPLNKIKCSEEELQGLLEYIDKRCYNNLSKARKYYVIKNTDKPTFTGAMLNDNLWIHPEVFKFGIEEKIINTINNKLVADNKEKPETNNNITISENAQNHVTYRHGYEGIHQEMQQETKIQNVEVYNSINLKDMLGGKAFTISIGFDNKVYILIINKEEKMFKYSLVVLNIDWKNNKVIDQRQNDLGVNKLYFSNVQPIGNNVLLIASWCCFDRKLNLYDKNNGLIVDYSGNVLNGIHLGDGIQDCIVDKNANIITSYFDEGVYGGGIGENGLNVFDTNGKIIWKSDKTIDDCYAINLDEKENIWYYYYSDFKLIKTDMKNEKIYEPSIYGASGFLITSDEKNIIFEGGYNKRNQFFIAEITDEKIGEFEKLKLICNDKDISIEYFNFYKSKAIFMDNDYNLYIKEF